MDPVRVRFAPSPTGYLHIGGARTALYNWLFAKKHGGTFILRIEDTDAERSTVESASAILDQLAWLGLTWDVGPNYQSRNLEAHRAAAYRLLETGHAYRCFATEEELDAKREEAIKSKVAYKYDGAYRDLPREEGDRLAAAGKPFTIRFRVPRGGGSVVLEDVIQGRIEKAYEDLEDFVILRSDGTPLYLLSNCVDDAMDGVTHVIRGQDGIANTPKQILLYRALGHPVPTFAHMALTLDMQGRKISKRIHGRAVSVGFFRERGFLPWALCNALVLLGWSTGDDREYFSRDELVAAFSLEGCNRANSKFGIVEEEKLGEGARDWTDAKALRINATYLRQLPLPELLPLVREWLTREDLWDADYEGGRAEWFARTVDLIRERFFTLRDFVTVGRCYFSDDYPVDPDAVKKNLQKDPRTVEYLGRLADVFAAVDPWEEAGLETALRKLADDLGVKAALLINGARTLVTGQSVGPSMFHVLMTLGRERTVDRLRRGAPRTEAPQG
jgi:glutamyl-tRNA synthetase